jgi:hypothetical protein
MNAAIFKQLQRPVLKMLDVGFLKLQSLSIGIYSQGHGQYRPTGALILSFRLQSQMMKITEKRVSKWHENFFVNFTAPL